MVQAKGKIACMLENTCQNHGNRADIVDSVGRGRKVRAVQEGQLRPKVDCYNLEKILDNFVLGFYVLVNNVFDETWNCEAAELIERFFLPSFSL